MPYHVFDSHASEYDAWYDTEAGKAIFAMEVECLKPLLYGYGRPYLEVGVGSGGFGQGLELGDGGLVRGLMLRNSPWGEFYAEKGRKGHPIYSKARFLSKEEIENLLQMCGFKVLAYRSTLFKPPGLSSYYHEQPTDSYAESAGFVAIRSRKQRIAQQKINL